MEKSEKQILQNQLAIMVALCNMQPRFEKWFEKEVDDTYNLLHETKEARENSEV